MKLILLVLTLWSGSGEPPKTEMETRVDRSAFPAPALEVLQGALASAREIRWYRETDGRQTGYEAKFRTRHGRYSAAFDSAGRWRDLERVVRERDLPAPVRATLAAWGAERNLRVRVTRVQERWLPDLHQPDAVRIAELVGAERPPVLDYEIETETHGGNTLARYEFRIGPDGSLNSVRRIADLTAGNLLF